MTLSIIDIINEIKKNNWESLYNPKNITSKEWNIISYHKNLILSEKFIWEFKSKLNWMGILSMQKLSKNFLRTYIEHYYLNNLNDETTIKIWDTISIYQNIDIEFINLYYKNLNWYLLSKFQVFSYDILSKYKELIKWNYLEYNKYDLDIVEYFIDFINWKKLCYDKKLSEEFIIKNYNKVDWENIGIYQKLSEDFIKLYAIELEFNCYDNNIIIRKNLLDLNIALRYQKLSCSFLNKYINKINFELISQYQELDTNFIIKYMKDLDWKKLCKYQKLNLELIEKNIDKIDFDLISKYQKLTNNFMLKYYTLLNWEKLVCYQKIDENIIVEYMDDIKFYWDDLSYNQILTENFIVKYQNLVDWEMICLKQNISQKFIIKFIGNISWSNLLTNPYVLLTNDFIKDNIEVISSSCIGNILSNYLRKVILFNNFKRKWKNKAYSYNGIFYKKLIKNYKNTIIINQE